MESKIKIIEEFMSDDKVKEVFSALNSSVMDYNILEITGMGNQEIKHSNVLGWIFSDKQHGVKYQVLDGFLKRITEYNSEVEDISKLRSYLEKLEEQRDVIVYREKDNIDLLILDRTNKVVIAIENKVYAIERTEGDDGGQLKKYEKIVNAKYPEYKRFFIFLTIDLTKASRENWLTASYSMITNTLEEILEKKDLQEKTKIIFESYIDLLKRSGIVEDEELKKLCKEIWNNDEYANAMDILLDYRTTPVSELYDKLKKEYKFQDNEYIELDSIKKLYEHFKLTWEEAENIFELQIDYHAKNDNIWIGFHYSDLKDQDDDFQKICREIIGEEESKKKPKEESRIYKIDRADLSNRDIDTVFKEIKETIDRYDQQIINILK